MLLFEQPLEKLGPLFISHLVTLVTLNAPTYLTFILYQPNLF